MRKIFLLVVFVLTGFSFAQTSKDVVTLPINTTYLNSLVLEICNQRSGIVREYNDILGKCSEYQSTYMAKYNVCVHDDTLTHKGVILFDHESRESFFDKKDEINVKSEICCFIILKNNDITYYQLSNKIYDKFYSSDSHKSSLINPNYTLTSFSCTYGVYKGEYGVYYGVYVTGVFGVKN